MRPALADYFLAIGQVVNAGKLLTVCAGEVRGCSNSSPEGRLAALIQATMVNVRL